MELNSTLTQNANNCVEEQHEKNKYTMRYLARPEGDQKINIGLVWYTQNK